MHPSILKNQGPCLILAGAGTGKTHTIVKKIKYLISNNFYPAENIVCLTFSNEAANSLRSRILPNLNDEKEPIIRTFHSFCSDLLKKHGDKIQLKKFNILLPDDAKILLHKNLKITPYHCNLYVSEMGIIKDLGITTEQIENYLKSKTLLTNGELEKELEKNKFEFHTTDKTSQNYKILKEKVDNLESLLKISRFLQTWKAYEKIKSIKNLLDYSDLNQLALKLLNENPEVSNDFDYIIVDEFQDTNKLQCDLLEKIAPQKNITVVGDLNQSIYRFRGAYKDNLSNFKKAFSISSNDIFTLDKSYRSTNKILKTAHKLIQNNYTNKNECFEVLNVYNKEGQNPEIYELQNNKEEVRKIIEIIKHEISKGVPSNEICVMFRTHQQSKLLKNSLEFENIPYTSITKKSLLKLSLIKIIRAYLSILNNISQKIKGADRAWWDLIHHSDFSPEDEISLGNYIKQNRDDPLLSIKFLNSPDFKLTERGSLQLKSIVKNLKNLIPEKESKITKIITKIYESLGLNSERIEKEKVIVLEKFYTLAKEHEEIENPKLEDFLHHLIIIDSLGIEIQAPELDNSGIRVMTSHSTKGLEYQTIILSNFAQKKFPIENFSNNITPSELSPELKDILSGLNEEEKQQIVKKYEQENQLLEERRLCYVSFTRAKSNLYLTYAKKYGQRSFYPSQFLNEIDYKKNPNLSFFQDNQLLYQEPKPELSNKPSEILSSSPNTASQLSNLIQQVNSGQDFTLSSEQSEQTNNLTKDKSYSQNKKTIFSPSSLQCFDECQKKYEYKHIFNMPEPIPVSWEALKLGSFVHKVLEEGVSSRFKTEKQFLDLAKTLCSEEKWQFLEIEEALPLIKVFYHRNKEKFNEKSLTEKKLFAKINNLDFFGIADRIDISSSGEIEIIDYKTGKYSPKPKYRNWQLGFYALASKSLGTPKKLTLEMLRKEHSLEFHIDSQGNAKEIHSVRTEFNLEEVKEQLVETANKILECQTSGFSPCNIEKNCDFCEEWVY